MDGCRLLSVLPRRSRGRPLAKRMLVINIIFLYIIFGVADASDTRKP